MTQAPRPLRPRRNQGAALIIVLWTVALLAIVAAIVAREAHLDTRESRMARESLTARLLAESGVRLALQRLDNPGIASAERFPVACRLHDGQIFADARPATALIDLNAADEDLLSALFTVLGSPPDTAAAIAARIADFRDADSLARPRGAEAQEYRRAGLPYGPANRPFSRNAELSEVLGIPPDLLQAALPHLTVHSHGHRIDAAYASLAVREALELFDASMGPMADADDIFGIEGEGAGFTGNPVVLTVLAVTASGQAHALSATYGIPRGNPAGRMRPLIEEHHVNADAMRRLRSAGPPVHPCL